MILFFLLNSDLKPKSIAISGRLLCFRSTTYENNVLLRSQGSLAPMVTQVLGDASFEVWLLLYAHRHRSMLGAAGYIILTPAKQLMVNGAQI
jgi:hypothetical protein